MSGSRYMSNHLDQYLARLDVYFQKREAEGLGVPESHKTRGVHSANCIATGTGIPAHKLEGSPPLREKIIEWSVKIGFTPAEHRRGGSARKREYEKKFGDYTARLKREGKKFPVNPGRAGTPDVERISSDSDIPVTCFSRSTGVGRLLRQAIKEVGLEIYPDSHGWGSISYGELLKAGSEWRREELKGAPLADQRRYNTRSSLRYFMLHAGELIRQTGFGEEDIIGVELLEKFEETLRSLTKQIESDSTRDTFSGQMRRWHCYYLRICRTKELPRPFIKALECAMNRAVMSLAQLADAAGVSRFKLNAWLSGINTPAVESFPEVRRLEEALSLTADTLTSRVIRTRPKQFPSSAYPEYLTVDGEEVKIRGNHKMRSLLRPLLPDDFDTRAEGERVEMLAELIKNLVRPTTDWGRWHRANAGIITALSEFPPDVEAEFKDLEKFKSSTLPPRGMKRKGSWSKPTVLIHKNNLLRFFGYLNLPPDAEDIRLCGLGFDKGLFTLAMLTQPAFIDDWLRWMARKRKGGEEEESYSLFDLEILNDLIGHLEPETGWLRQKPELAKNLKPIPGYMDETFIARARSDWKSVCDEALGEYKSLAESVEEVAEEQRDPFELILPLLDVDHPSYQNPILALRTFAQNILNDLPDPALAPVRAARHVRSYLTVRILTATVLRSRNIRELTYREDNKGHLRRRGDKWVIAIPRKLFKNKHSSFFGSKKKHDYEKVLADKDGLYGWIEEYINKHRPVLLKGSESDVFFFNTPDYPVTPAPQFHKRYRLLTMYYLAHNPYLNRGVPGVKPHGPHAVRDIFATFVIQLTGSYELAAYILQDSLRTVRDHYTNFMPKDKTRLVDYYLNAAWDGEPTDESPIPAFLRQVLTS
jgi:hypothetical protein